jgi:hypothetical protein
MRLSTFLITSVCAVLAAAQGPNHFTMATIPVSIPAGSTFNITWAPSTSGTISLLLVQASGADSTNVHTVSTIAGTSSLFLVSPPSPAFSFPQIQAQDTKLT